MKVKILKDFPGSTDGVTVNHYKEGEVIDASVAFLNTFVTPFEDAYKYAEPVVEQEIETKVIEPEFKEPTYADLKAQAKKLKIKGYTKMDYDTLSEAIADATIE